MSLRDQMKMARDVRNSMVQFVRDPLFEGFGEECSPSSLRKLFMSSNPLGDEAIAIIPKMFFVNVVIYDTCRCEEYMRTEAPDLPTCIILFNGGHYSSFSMSGVEPLECDRLFHAESPALLKNV